MKTAVVLFAYKRPKYLRKAIKTHKKVEGLDYIAFIDYSEMQKEIYEIIDEANLYKTIYRLPERFGLNQNIISGISLVLKTYDAVIVLEDDLLLAGDALEFLKYNLEYFSHPYIYAVSCHKGEPLDKRFRCWAWGTWRSAWTEIDWSLMPKEKNRGSWDVIVNENFNQKGWFCYCSEKPRVKHIGWSGTHYSFLDLFSVRRLWRKLSSRI